MTDFSAKSPLATAEELTSLCICHRCIRERDLSDASGLLPLNSTRMILCPSCENKRCPKASDHRLACTGSNATGQPGSVYE